MMRFSAQQEKSLLSPRERGRGPRPLIVAIAANGISIQDIKQRPLPPLREVVRRVRSHQSWGRD
jgi:hypothetical protein